MKAFTGGTHDSVRDALDRRRQDLQGRYEEAITEATAADPGTPAYKRAMALVRTTRAELARIDEEARDARAGQVAGLSRPEPSAGNPHASLVTHREVETALAAWREAERVRDELDLGTPEWEDAVIAAELARSAYRVIAEERGPGQATADSSA